MAEEAISGSVADFQKWQSQLLRKQGTAVVRAGAEDPVEFSRDSNPKGYAPSLANAKLAIQKLGIVFRLDTFRQRVITEGWPKELGETSEKIELVVRKLVIERFGFDPEPRHTRDAIELVALENAFDPVREYLDGLRWDGVPRLDTWLRDYLGAPDDPLTSAIGRAVLTGAVRRVRQPCCKFDGVMVLEGPQGGGKSSALKVLAGGEEFFSDEIATDVPYKEQQELLQGKWIVELPELVGLSNTQVGRLKQFISKTHDRGRPAFARSVVDLPRRGILIGTTNDAQYLRDPTGGRRFWPVEVGRVDQDGLRAVRDQLWAEAAEAEPSASDPITIPEALWGEAARRQAERVAGDIWDDLLEAALPEVAKAFDGELRITALTIFEKVLKMEPKAVPRRDMTRLADCMRRLGWTGPKAMRIDGALVKGYARQVDMAP
ncbi:virulence-associated E family protein [Neorhizobium sp. T7_12]|uniref:virulence-associated E family protein n=1 Tax=Neorhizobium sp. T7_12 TaxID=2093832 RepID=UPI001FDF2377|nr:virulence-associated E family protein [Neorhizobium sp. T7_12]